ncbi:MAG: histidinol-phosphatase (PHP family) [Bradymonadia bacterium]
MLEAAVDQGFAAYGVSEHAPRYGEHLLYDQEREWGWEVPKLIELFDSYTTEIFALAEEFEGRLDVLRGFEAEVVPGADWLPRMNALRSRGFDFVVGSVHHVREISLDGPMADFERALELCGGLEPLVVEYYESLAKMVRLFQPEVVGHLDLVRKNGRHVGDVDTPRARDAAMAALEQVKRTGGILDLNCAAYRKGMQSPYPAPWLVAAAHDLGIPFCFGDDSHGASEVGQDLERGRDYLLQNGVRTITMLRRTNEGVAHVVIEL